MAVIENILSWAQSIGVGGAFFVITLAAFAVVGLALMVALAALKRGKP